MFYAFIAFLSTFLLGVVIYGSLWWQGSDMSWRVTKWYFGIFFIAALVVGVITYFSGS